MPSTGCPHKPSVLRLAGLITAAWLLLAACAGPSSTTQADAPGLQAGQTAVPTTPGQSAEAPQPVYALSGGVEITLPADRCADLDAGTPLGLDDPACDFGFSLSSGQDQDSLTFIPLSYAVFNFSHVFWDLPDAQACSLAASFSSAAAQINPQGGYFACYQTGQGHWGLLKFRRLSADGLTFYWITYPEQAELIARQAAFYPGMQSAAQEPAPTRTPLPEERLSQAVSRWVKVDQGLDLDSGAIAAGWNGADDLVVTAGEVNEIGRLLNLQLQPAGKAAVQGGAGFDQAPTAADCRQTVDYTNRPLIITDLYRFRCFQTSEGRLGYLYVHESNPGVGVRLDWVTWPAVQEQTVQPEPSPTAIESGAAVKVMAPAQATGVKTYRPGSQITFTWQITNTGRVTWNTRYALVLARGSALGGPEKKLIPYPITNGMTVRLALSLTVPAEPGAYLAEYWLVDDTGRRFGIGGNGSRPLQLIINSGEPGLTLAEGQGAQLAPGECFDLDTGYPSIDDPACDFSVSASADPAMAQIYSSQTGFDFITPFASAPTLGQCQIVRLASGTRTVGVKDWYVCFKTQQGRYGWLKVLESSSGGLLFDWKTYQ